MPRVNPGVWRREGETAAVWPGHRYPLGATWSVESTNVAVYAPAATAVSLCLFADPEDDAAETRIELIERRGEIALYQAVPLTGRTHQLRVHFASLGIPIAGDPFYPELLDKPRDDFTDPLQLLAHTLRFPDPVDGNIREFRSRQELERWPR